MMIFVGNLPFEAGESDVRKLFADFGNVASVAIVMEKEKKAPKSRGFGFVDMPDDEHARAAIAGLNGREFMGRPLNLAPARPKPETAPKERGRPAPRKPRVLAAPQVTEDSPARHRPFKGKPGAYKSGRRTKSFVLRQGLPGVPLEKPRHSDKANPGRWRKKTTRPRKPRASRTQDS